MNSECPVRIRCVVTGSAEFGDFVTAVNKHSHHIALIFRVKTAIQLHLGLEA